MKLILAAFFTFSITLSAFAAPQKQQAKPQGPVSINARSLRVMLLDRNLTIAMAMNQVEQSKQQVNVARGNLLPNIGLGGVIESGPSFMLTTVSSLLPFLMPSKWMDLKESQHLLTAQAESYYIAQLNAYSSAYSMYMTILGDQQLRAALVRQYENLKAMEEELRVPAEMGMIRKEDYLQAQAQAELALVQVSQVDDLLQKEKASVRQMLGLPLSQEITFETSNVPASKAEGQTAQALLDQVHEKSPESKQMNSMILAAQVSKFSKGFSFLSGSSLGKSRAAGGSFGSFEQTGSINFGFSYFPELAISNLQMAQLRMRKQELKLDQAELLESTLGSLKEAYRQYDSADKAYINLLEVYDSEALRYKLGMTDIQTVLQASNALTTAITGKAKAQTALNTLRISLHRVMISDQFEAIESCRIQRDNRGGIKNHWGRLVNKDKWQVTLDEACGK